MEFEFQKCGRNYNVDFRQTFLTLKLKYVKNGGYETTITRIKKKNNTRKKEKKLRSKS